MWELEPGPFAFLDPASLRTLAPRRSFTGIVADALDDSAGIRGALDSAARDATDNPPDDLDGAYASTIGVAHDIVGNDIQAAPPSPVPTLLETGENATTIRESVKQYLPSPDVPITAPFTDPPHPPGGGSEPAAGRGGSGGGDSGRA